MERVTRKVPSGSPSSAFGASGPNCARNASENDRPAEGEGFFRGRTNCNTDSYVLTVTGFVESKGLQTELLEWVIASFDYSFTISKTGTSSWVYFIENQIVTLLMFVARYMFS
jgi:hypothetical protein